MDVADWDLVWDGGGEIVSCLALRTELNDGGREEGGCVWFVFLYVLESVY